MSDQIIEQIPSMQTEELWNMFQMLYYDGVIDEKDYNFVKFGHNLKLDIRFYVLYKKGDERLIRLYPKAGTIGVGNKEMSVTDFMDEFEERDARMRSILLGYYEGGETTEPR